jgi:golgin subfamily B member 1
MDFDTIRAALGELQHDAYAADAWDRLTTSLTSPSKADGAQLSEASKLLAAARAAHARRGEWLAVATLLELELELVNGQAGVALGMELGRVSSHELVDDARANAAYQKVLEFAPGDELALVALSESAERASQWQQRVEAYAQEAQAAQDDVYKASMLMRAAESEWRFGGEELNEGRVLALLAEASELDPRNAMVLQILELIYRKQQAWPALAVVLERWATHGAEESARAAAAIRLARLRAQRLNDGAGAAMAYEQALAAEPSHPEAKAALSEYYSQAENWTKLVQLYERDLGPAGHTRADRLGDMLQIAMLHYRKRNALSDAAPWFQRIREIEPANGAMLTFYRDFARETGDEALLLTVLQAAQKVLPEGSEKQGVTREIAKLAESQQDAQKAIEQYGVLLRQNPRNVEAAESLKALYRKTQGYPQLVEMLRHELDRVEAGDKERRIAILREVAGIYRDHLPNDTSLVSALNQLLQIDETNTDAVRELIGLYEKLGRGRDLLANQHRLAQLTTDSAEKAELLRASGRRWLDQFSNVQNATNAFEELLKIVPSDREACDTLTQLYKKRRAWPELYALHEGQLPSLEGPARVVVMKEMASLAAERLKKPSEAANLYQQILAAEPGNLAILDALEKHAERSKDYPVLANVLEQRIAGEREVKNQVGLLQKLGALQIEHLKDEAAAMSTWRRVLSIEPRQPRAMRVLRDYMLEHAAYDDLQELYAQQGDFEGLAEVLSGAADKTTDLRQKIDLSYRAAQVLEGPLGHPERAFRSYERILTVDPMDAKAAGALIPLYEHDEKWGRLPTLYELVLANTKDVDAAMALYEKLVSTIGGRLNDKQGAIKVALRAWAQAPSHPQARKMLEAACADAHDWEPLAQALGERITNLRQAPPKAEKTGKGKKKAAPAAPPVDQQDIRELELELVALLEDKLKRPADAQLVLRRLVEGDPSDAVAVQHLDRLLRAGGDRENLRWLMDLRINNSEPEIQVVLLHEWARIEEEVFEAPDRASALYGRVLELEPTDREALTHLTRLVLAEGQAEEAVAVMKQHRDLLVGDERVRLEEQLAETLLYRLEQPEAALQSALGALSGAASGVFPQRAVEVLQRLVQVDTTKRQAANALATVYQERRERRKEADALGVLLSVEEDPETRLSLFRRGISVFEELDSFNAAFELMLKALRDFPEQMSLWDQASVLSGRAGRGAELADAYRDVLRGDLPTELRKALCQRAATLHEVQLGDPVGATPYLEQVLELDPTDTEAFARLKNILTSNQRWGELRALYDQTLEGAKGKPNEIEILGEVAMVCEEFMEDYRAAQGYYEHTLKIDPSHEGALRALDRLYSRHQQYDKLAELLEHRISLAQGDDATVLRLRAAALYLDERHQPEKAMDKVDEVLLADLNNARGRELAERILGIGSLKRRASELLEKVYDFRDDPRELVRVLDAQLQAMRSQDERDRDEEVGLLERLAGLRYDRLKDDLGAFSTLTEYVPERPDDALARKKLSDIGERQGQQAKVADVLELAATAASDVLLKSELLMSVGHLREGVLADPEKAAAVYRRVLDLDPNDATIIVPAAKALERIYEQRDEVPLLVDVLRLELKHEASSEERLALLERIALLCEQKIGDRDAAIAAWKQRLEEVPDDMRSLRALDQLYTAVGRYGDLVAILSHQAELLTAPDERRSVMLRLAAIHQDQLSDKTAAIEAYRAVHGAFAPEESTLVVLAGLLEQEQRYTELEDTLLARLELATENETRASVWVTLGNLRRLHLKDPNGALDAYRKVTEIAPSHAGARAALTEMLQSPEAQHRREAAEILVPVFRGTNDHQALLGAYRVLVEVKEDPLERVEVLELATTLAEQELSDLNQAFELTVRAIREAVGHTDLGPWIVRLEKLAEATGRRADQVALYREVVEDAFDGDVQYTLLFRIAELSARELQDDTTALAYFKRSVEVRPDSREALLALESMYVNAEQWEPLLGVLSQRIDASSTDAERQELMLRKAVVYEEKLGRPSEAIETYEAALDVSMDARAIESLHRLYQSERRFSNQVQLLERQLDTSPDQAPTLHVQISKVASQQLNDVSRAFDELEAALRAEPAFPEAMQELERLMTEPNVSAQQHARAAMVLEPIYLSRGDYDRVMAAIRAQLEQSDSVERRELMQRLAQLAEEQKEDYGGALDILAQLLRDDLTDSDTIAELERLAKVGDCKPRLAAIYRTELERVDESEPSTAALSLRTGQLYDELREPDLALTFYRRALRFEPDNIELFAAIDAILQKADRPAERVALYQAALEYRLDPDDRVLLLHTLGELLAERLGNKDRAIEVYAEALRFDDGDTLAMDNLGRLYFDTERYEELYELVSRRAATAIEDEHVIAFRLALAKLCKNELSDNTRAIGQLEEIVHVNPRHPEALAELNLLRQVPEQKARVVEILRPLFEQTDDWRATIDLNRDRLALSDLPGDQVAVLRETAELWELRGKDQRQAFAVLSHAVTVDPDDEEVRSELERLALATSEWNSLAKVYSDVLSEQIDSLSPHTAADIWLRLAQVHDGPRNDPRSALLAYDQVRHLDATQLEPLERMEALATLLSDWAVLDHVLVAKAELVYGSDERASLWRRAAEGRRDMLNKPIEAIAGYEKALEFEPDSAFTVDCLIDLYEIHKNPKRLVELYELRVDLSEPDEGEQSFGLLVKAAEVTETEFRDIPRAIELYNQALTHKPEDQEVLVRLSNLYRAEMRWSELLDNQRVLSDLAETPEQRNALRVQMGDLLAQQMDSFADALEMYQLVLEQSPTERSIWDKVFKIGQEHEELREPAAAVLVPALVASNAHKERADALEMRLTVEEDPTTRANTLRAIADVYQTQISDKPAALNALLRAMSDVPEDESLHAEIETLAKALVDYQAYANALAERAKSTFDADVGKGLLARLGRVSRDELKDPKRAIGAYSRAVELVGDEPDLLEALDGLYVQTENWPALAEVLERRTLSSESDEERAQLYARLAQVQLERFNEGGQALESLRSALEIDPLHDEAKALLETLTEDRDLFDEASEVLETVYRARRATDSLAKLYEKRVQFAQSPGERRDMRKALASVLEEELHNASAAQRVLQAGMAEDLDDVDLLSDVERLAGVSNDWLSAASALAEALGSQTVSSDLRRELTLRAAEWYAEKAHLPDEAESLLVGALEASGSTDEENEDLLLQLDSLQARTGREMARVATLRRRARIAHDPESSEELYRQAERLALASSDRSAAESVLRELLAAQDNNAWALEELSRLREEAGDNTEVFSLLERRIDLVLGGVEAQALRHQAAALAKDKLHKDDAAVRLYEQLFEDDPLDVRASSALRELYLKQKDYRALATLLERLVDIADNTEQQNALRLELIALRADHLGDSAGAADLLRNLVADQPGNLDAVQKLTHLYQKEGKYEDLAQLLSERVAYYESQALTKEQLECELRLVEVYRDQLGETGKAVSVLEDVLARTPDELSALSQLSTLHESLGHPAEAAEVLTRLVNRSEGGDKVPFAKRLAGIYASMGEMDNSIAALEQAFLVEPNDLALRDDLKRLYKSTDQPLKLAEITVVDAEHASEPAEQSRLLRAASELYLAEGSDPERAAELLEAADKITPDDRSLLLLLCDAYTAAGRANDAIAALERVVESFGGRRSRELADVHRRLAAACQAQGNLERAIVELDKAFRMEPGSISVLKALGELTLEAGDYKRAQQMFRSLLLQKLDNNSVISKAEVYYYLGVVHHKLGENDKAVQMLERALQTDPMLDRASELLSTLKR